MAIETQLEEIQKQANELSNRVATEGVTDESGRVLVAPTVNDVKDTIGFPENFQSQPPQTGIQSLTNIGVNASSLTKSLQEQLLENQRQQEQINKSLGVKEGESTMGKIVSLQTGVSPSGVEQKTQSVQEQYGIPTLTKETQQQALKVASLSGDIDKLEAQKLGEIDRIYSQQGVPMRFIQGQASETERKFNIEKAYKSAELGAQAAVLQAQTGNLELANNMVKDIVNAYTFDIQQQRQDVSDLINVYSDWFTSLEKDEQSILTNLSNRLEQEEKDTKSDLTDKLNLMTEAANNGVNLGLSVSDLAGKTLAEVAQLYQEKVSLKKAETSTLQSAGFKDSKIEASFREDGASLKLQVRAGGLTIDEAYQQLRDLYSPSEVTDQAIKDYLGIIAPESVTPPSATIMPDITISGKVVQGANQKPVKTQDAIYDFLFSGSGNTVFKK